MQRKRIVKGKIRGRVKGNAVSLITHSLLLGNLVMFSHLAQAAGWSITSTAQQATLVELFTSQGCSSCPPADGWLAKFKDHPLLFKQIVPVAYHVTYWDYLGWQDPFGQPAHDQRHRQQAAAVDAGVYTPGVFLQGQEWRGWRRHSSGQTPNPAQQTGILSAAADGEPVVITYKPAVGQQAKTLFAHLTYLRMSRSTEVSSGENRGRELQHNFIAGEVVSGAMEPVEGQWQTTIRSQIPNNAQAVAFWVTDSKGVHLQASGGYLH